MARCGSSIVPASPASAATARRSAAEPGHRPVPLRPRRNDAARPSRGRSSRTFHPRSARRPRRGRRRRIERPGGRRRSSGGRNRRIHRGSVAPATRSSRAATRQRAAGTERRRSGQLRARAAGDGPIGSNQQAQQHLSGRFVPRVGVRPGRVGPMRAASVRAPRRSRSATRSRISRYSSGRSSATDAAGSVTLGWAGADGRDSITKQHADGRRQAISMNVPSHRAESPAPGGTWCMAAPTRGRVSAVFRTRHVDARDGRLNRLGGLRSGHRIPRSHLSPASAPPGRSRRPRRSGRAGAARPADRARSDGPSATHRTLPSSSFATQPTRPISVARRTTQ